MSEMKKNIIGGLIICAISTVIGGTFTYLVLIKEHDMLIKQLLSDTAEIKDNGKVTHKTLVATKLFIAQAHPDRDITNLASMYKLRQIGNADIRTMAEFLEEIIITTEPKAKIVDMPTELEPISEKYGLNAKDFIAFREVAELPYSSTRFTYEAATAH